MTWTPGTIAKAIDDAKAQLEAMDPSEAEDLADLRSRLDRMLEEDTQVQQFAALTCSMARGHAAAMLDLIGEGHLKDKEWALALVLGRVVSTSTQ